MHVLLLILKILGIILGSIVGVVLFLVLLVALVPIRYAGYLDKNEKLYAKARGSWLLHLLHITFVLEDKETELKVKLFGFTIYPKKEKPQKPKKKKKKKSKKPEKAGKEKIKNEPAVPAVQEDKQEEEQENLTLEQPVEMSEEYTDAGTEELHEEKAEAPAEEQADDLTQENSEDGTEEQPVEQAAEQIEEQTAEQSEEQNTEDKTDFFDKLEKILDKADDAFEGFSDKIKNIYDNIAEKLENIYNKWVKLKNIVDDERVTRTVKLALKLVGKALKHILPRRIKGYAEYGFDDPSTTGYISAVLGALYGRLGEAFTFNPDFSEKKLNANVKFRGRIRIGRLGLIALRLLLNRDFKYSKKLIMSKDDDDSKKDSKNRSDFDSDFDEDSDIEEDF